MKLKSGKLQIYLLIALFFGIGLAYSVEQICDPPLDVPEKETTRYIEACEKINTANTEFRTKFKNYTQINIGSGVPALGHSKDESIRPIIKGVIDVMVDEMHLDLLHFSIPFSSITNPQPWRELLEYAQNKGVETMIIAEDLDTDPTWNQYHQLHMEFVNTWAGSTNHFMVISDPTFPWSPTSRITDKDTVTVQQVAELAQQAARSVKTNHPNTTILAGMPGRFTTTFPQNHELMNQILTMPEFDAWSIYYFSIDDLYEAETDIQDWQQKGKQVWMLANYATPNRQQYHDNPWIDHLVGQFIDTSINYAESQNITTWEWAWPMFFWTYQKITTPDTTILQYRTDTGTKTEHWARTYKNLTTKNYPYPTGEGEKTIRRWWLIGAVVVILLFVYLATRR